MEHTDYVYIKMKLEISNHLPTYLSSQDVVEGAFQAFTVNDWKNSCQHVINTKGVL